MQYREGCSYLGVGLLMVSSPNLPNSGNLDHGMLILTWFNSEESHSFQWPGWACFIYALKPLSHCDLCKTGELKAQAAVWAGEGHSLVWKTFEMWSRLVGRMRNQRCQLCAQFLGLAQPVSQICNYWALILFQAWPMVTNCQCPGASSMF